MYAFLVQKTVKDAAVPLGGGAPVDQNTYYEYDPVTGRKMAETDPRGFRTSYQYDALNRVVRVTLPDDDGNESNNPYRRYVFDDQNNLCDYYNELGQRTRFGFDELGRMTEIVKDPDHHLYQNGIKTVYHYDDWGRIDTVTDSRGNDTTYGYDGLNRVIKVTYPKNNNPGVVPEAVNLVVVLQYDDLTNTVTMIEHENSETGPEIGRTVERSDWASRLVEANQYCTYNGVTEIFNWEFAYDSTGNKLRQIDPQNGSSNPIDQAFDVQGRMTQVQLPTALLTLSESGDPEKSRPEIKYEYDNMGNKTADMDAKGNRVEYEYNKLGLVIKVTTTVTNHLNHRLVTAETRNFYDADGHKILAIDPNGKEWRYIYSAQGWLLSEEDPLHQGTSYQYDAMGNKTRVTDPRGFVTRYVYDELGRLVKTILPDKTLGTDSDNPTILVTYDENGNKLTETDPTGVTISYTYSPRNLVETVKAAGELKTTYKYDAKGNPVEVKDATGQVTRQYFDSLGRLRKMLHPAGNYEEFSYDAIGNKVGVTDGRNNSTQYTYNPLGWLTEVCDPLQNKTSIQYDVNGNQVKVTAPNKLVTINRYDELNRVYETVDSLEHSTLVSYGLNGNQQEMIDRRGSHWVYQYLDNNLLEWVKVYAAGSDISGNPDYQVEYTYDEAGNRKTVSDTGNRVAYNLDENGLYQADPLNRINMVSRSFDGASYITRYQYNKAGQLTQILYPEADGWLNYNYDNQNRLKEVVGFTAPNGITYDADGAVHGITYQNGVMTTYDYDSNRRLASLKTGVNLTDDILNLSYTYDNANNITQITDGGKVKTYEYDANNQLTKAVTPGKFEETQPTGASNYYLKTGDYPNTPWLELNPILTGILGLDYNSSSISVDFGSGAAARVKKILLIPNNASHRIVKQKMLDLFTSDSAWNFTVVPRNNWTYEKDAKGVISLTLNEVVVTRYLKIHVKFDDWDADGNPKNDMTFLNEVAQMLQVYQEADSRTEEYEYDAAGNRTSQRITLVQSSESNSLYYANSDRLKTDGKYAFKYDNAGNLTEKGNIGISDIKGDQVTFRTPGANDEYWHYTYDLLNRLTKVEKNGTLIAEYEYDPDGLRVVKKAHGETVHYVFDGTEPIYEKNVTTSKIKNYIFAGNMPIARVDGVLGDSNSKKYWITTDYIGNYRVVTNDQGRTVWQSDYMPFGNQFEKSSDPDFEEWNGLTGKELDPDTGLMYFNARWYDADTGRFISEDPAMDPNSPNLYAYCANDPISRIDPTGNYGYDAQTGQISFSDGTVIDTKGNVISTPNGGSGGTGGSGGSGGSGGGNNNSGNSNNPTIPSNPWTPNGTENKVPTDQEIVLDLARMYDEKDRLIEQLNNATSMSEIAYLSDKIKDCDYKLKNAITAYSQITKSKLSLQYKVADPSKYLIFGDSSKSGIDPIFAGRLAALAKDHKTTIYIGPQSGLRSYQDTVDLWLDNGGLYNSETGKFYEGPDFNYIPAYPGKSWHVNGEAVDAGSSQWIMNMCNGATITQKELLKYGLFKPLSTGNGYPTKTQKAESWHLQPIETNGITDVQKRREFYTKYAL